MLDQCTNPGGTIQNKNQRTGNLSVRMKSISVFFCLLYAMWTEGTSINVMGFERGKVSFQCSHRLAWRNFKYLCKDPCKQDTDMLATVKSGRRVESGRITLVDLGNGVFTVTFSQLQLSDSGKYWCAVDRPGFDTFTAVYLTVKTAVAQETTTATPELSVSTSAQLTSATNLSTASNCTSGGEQNISTGTMLYATIGGVTTLTVLALAACFRKCKKNSKPRPQVCSNSTGRASAHADYEYEFVEEVRSVQKLSCAMHLKQGSAPSASAAAECDDPHHIYENICCSKSLADSKCSAAHFQDELHIASGIYIEPLPQAVSERTGDGYLGKHPDKPTPTRKVSSRPREICTNDASAHHTRSGSDYTEVRPRSLWFGLDLSGAF
ncbi:uncharacterized protein LOC121604490 isoform X2 [Chelmon rostratus]|uniref:uncharacterized protein LOC121604490 isoform X2 n=1 Tax=Chelmon rostratus TaxID=109905 RepID=UPI001BE5E1E6|nr:uncharacterized protein LOC121604490 isoform X2 [Chelmon rostratus]